jgi:hypothetical protein
LARAFAEEDGEVELASEGSAAMPYKFKCKHCGSQFSLEQQLEEHEAECGKVGAAEKPSAPASSAGVATSSAKPMRCKYCGEVFEDFGRYGAHRWAVHREGVLAELAKRREERKADEKKIDAQIKGNGHRAGAETAAPSSRPPKVTASPAAPENGTLCPTCGGPLSTQTAQLVAEFRRSGIPEPQAFELIRIARRVLITSPTN